jgi:nucleotide-binding universal stress UspA family protein
MEATMNPGKANAPGPILVPVDFSPHSAEALVFAARLGECLDAPLRVLHVAHDPESAPGYYLQSKRKKHLKRISEAAAEMMEDFLNRVRKENPELGRLQNLEPLLVEGLPVNRILEVADKIGASQIVVGSQGRTGLPHLLLGSKAERVAQLSPLPVTIVKVPPKKRPHD